jgi:competence protein ComEC
VSGPPPDVRAGDRVRCFTILSAPPGPQNPGAFNYRDHLRSEGIRSDLRAKSPSCISVIEPGNWLNPRRILDQVRARSNQLFEDYLDPRCAEMAAGVLLGERDQIESERIETFMATGTIHLLVIAGLHLGILAGAMFWVARRTPLPRGWAIFFVGFTTAFYMLLVDAGPPVVRATVLILSACAAAQLGRRPLGFNSLAAAALVVLAINPTHLFHVGAQLSFLSVAGLIWFAPRWLKIPGHSEHADDSLRPSLGAPRRVARAVARTVLHMILISLTIWLLTMPLVMARFHLCTPIAILINAVVWLPMACALVSGFALLVVGGLSPLVGHLCGGFCNLNLWLLEWCVTTARRIPGGNFWVAGPADWWLLGFYGGLGVLAAFPRIRPRRIVCLALLAGWIAIGFLPLCWRRHPDRLDCTFVAVGHGTAAVLDLPSGKTILYDAGQFGAPSAGVRAISGFLWSRGITRLDAVFLSHADVDHYNALPGLMDRFSVGAVYVPPAMFKGSGQAIAALHATIDRHGVSVRQLRTGDQFSEGSGCTIEVLHPSGRDTSESTNANSLVLAVDYRGRQILLPGDLESHGMQELLATRPRHCELLMAPHHGSRQSNSPGLARWCTPAWVVFSDDGRWNLPEIDATYQAVGSQTLHTNDSGAIEVQIDAHGVRVTPFLARQP